jgi:hypothetical protein
MFTLSISFRGNYGYRNNFVLRKISHISDNKKKMNRQNDHKTAQLLESLSTNMATMLSKEEDYSNFIYINKC